MTNLTSTLIQQARVLDPASGKDEVADVWLAEGKVQRIASGIDPASLSAASPRHGGIQVIDGQGKWLMPGLVDLAARLREPGYEYKATLESEMRAALAGGVTSLSCPPDTDPPLDEPGLVEMLKHRARLLDQAHLYPLGALTVGLKGQTITEMAELAEAGCVGFSQAMYSLQDTQVLVRAMQYAKTFGFVLWLYAQDASLAKGGVAHSGPVAGRLGLPGVPVMAETIALFTIFEAMRSTGCRVHLCRLSSAQGVAMLRAAKAEGLPVTADVAVHHLHFTDNDIGYFDAKLRVDPPFRSQRDREALHEALADGTIDAICSDHTPVEDDGKLLPFAEAEAGATALELVLPLTLAWAKTHKVSINQALCKLTSEPAKIIRAGGPSGSQAQAVLQEGAVADLVLFDPKLNWICEPRKLLSQGKHTPFQGYEIQGRVSLAFIAGRLAWPT